MKILFTQDWRDENGVMYKAGTLREVPAEMAQKLITDGVAIERKEERGPAETKQDIIREDDTGDAEDDEGEESEAK